MITPFWPSTNYFASSTFVPIFFNITLYSVPFPMNGKKQLRLNDVSKNLRHVSNTSFSTRSISCKKAYKILVRKHTDPPTSQGRLIKYGINESELSLYYLSLTHETKLSLFQFKILHNILPTNLHLYRIKPWAYITS